MTWYIHVNKHKIAANRKNGHRDPPVRVQRGKRGKATYCWRVFFEEGEMIYSPHKPILPCGARLVIATETEPQVIE